MARGKKATDEQKPAAASLDGEEQLILNYLKKQNRPYSAIDVFNNLHGEVGKTSCVRILTNLAERGLIHQKTYGKQSVYVVKQTELGAPTPAELAALDSQIENINSEINGRTSSIQAYKSKLASITSYPPTDSLRESIIALQNRIEEKKVKLETLSKGGVQVNSDERIKVIKQGQILSKQVQSRKRLCMDIVNGILDGAGESMGKKSAKEMMEEMGCEL